mmetsp:Transcript_4891/g.2728  ORF Transcript_4891/g.2728 Transcript_4891/m.2728 type:complete len:199 (-) Transcript_4891:2438-3034(-)
MIGKTIDVNSLADEALKDKDYFLDSNGGITLSGGEPMIYAKFLEKFLPKLKNIHVTIETCGVFKYKQIKKIIPYLDLIYFDIKLMDSHLHKKYTGRDNNLILENFSNLSKSFKNLQARMPIIPGINDNRKNITATANFLKEHRHKTIHCLPYHNMGEAKLLRIDTKMKSMNLKSSDADALVPIRKIFNKEGINAVIYD